LENEADLTLPIQQVSGNMPHPKI